MKRIIFINIAVLLAFSPVFGQGEIRARGDFLKSREQTKSVGKPIPKLRKQPTANRYQPPVGLGYTVFLKDEAEGWMRVSTKRAFISGQQIKVLLETNIDGYLYIFHQENDQPITLFFPNLKIQNGNNQIKANRPLLVPEGNAWRFDHKPAIETLTFIVSRVPMKGIPIGGALNQVAGFRPPQDVLQQIMTAANPLEDSVADEGKTMTKSEQRRGIELVPTDPAPTSIFMSQTEREERVVVRLKLTHK